MLKDEIIQVMESKRYVPCDLTDFVKYFNKQRGYRHAQPVFRKLRRCGGKRESDDVFVYYYV